MSYPEKQSKQHVEPTQNMDNTSTIALFSDQRASTALQLKQQQRMQTMHRPEINQYLKNNPVQGNVLQAVTKVVNELDDATSTTTKSKEIETRTQNTKWFKFAINGNVINSFSNNIYSGPGTAGSNPVSKQVEIGGQATTEGSEKTDIPSWSRAKHFGLGDRATGIKASDRKGKWTWHHQNSPYYMELVDMYVHGGFGHHGGYANWDNDVDSDDTLDG